MRPILPPLVLWLAIAIPTVASGQEPSGQRAGGQEALRVFLDCANFFCDFDHVRREVQFVSWVRDRRDADVHVLGTSRRTGGGGREYTLTFIGQRTFAGREDTLRYVARDTDTEDEVRRGLTRVLGLGLVAFAARTSVAEGLQVSYQLPVEAPAQPVTDPWDYWVFRIRVSGNFNGEETYSSSNASLRLSANRTTETLKINLAAGGSYRRDSYDLGGPERFVTIQRGYDLNGLVVWSLGPRWSTGVRASASSSTFLNQDLAVRGGPALEYNLFRYEESTRRQLTFLYSIGPAGFDYQQQTIFDKTSEVVGAHSFQIAASVKQPWGTVNASAEAFEFLHDLSKHRLTLSGGMNLRVFRGLELNVFGVAERIKDQLYLSKEGLSPEEILARRRQLGTDFRYFANLGLSYRFGSIFNNVVNPRFEGGGPIFFIIQ